ncbi:DUF4184 family protein [Peterkaempfera griseoplana]|uniref:DUF4184 family protein n=1 Tax=Peterkaempfera griseoplana TaxID=66896 RepID=UPI0006E3C8C5|nr:DUF4184 family protein [Peterkaempfera griseoplana]
MPFTLSHPAAVLPFLRHGRARGPWVASALVAGSMAPDVPYFADSLVHGAFGYGAATHSPWAVPTLDVAIAAVLAAGWHGLLREPLTALLPDRWGAAVDELTRRRRSGVRPRDAGWFALSAALGAATHVCWDSFTHHDRAGVRLLPVLNRTVAGQPLHHWLQYGGSALALLWLAGWAVATTRRAADAVAPGAERRRLRLPVRTRTGVLVLAAAAAAVGAVHRTHRWTDLHGPAASPADLVPTVCFGAGTGLAVGLALYAAAALALRPRDADPATTGE